MDLQFDDYWNRSSRAAFSFDDEDEVDLAPELASNGILADDTISEASFNNSATLNLSIKSILSEEALKLVLQEQALDDRVLPKGVSPEEELKLLRRQLQSTLYSPNLEATAQKLLQGKTAPLEMFKSLQEKQQLLDTLMAQGGGHAVITVLLFLKRTLNTAQFHGILRERPKALEQYLSYLKESGDLASHIELLQRFGRHQEAALKQFQAALAAGDVSTRKKHLQLLVDAYATAGVGVIPLYEQVFHAALKMQQIMEKENGLSKMPADIANIPYIVSIQLFGIHHCGGSIINKHTILTAAHCLNGVSYRLLKVKVGGTSRYRQDGELFSVSGLQIHDKFNAKTMDYDIGIIRLTKNLTLSNKVGCTLELQMVNANLIFYILR